MPAYTWVIASMSTHCGYDWAHVIAAGEPMLEIRFAHVKEAKRRCQSCGQRHMPLTDAVIESAQQARADVLERQALQDEGAALAPVRFARPPRLVKSFTSMAESAATLFDPKAAAAGDRE